MSSETQAPTPVPMRTFVAVDLPVGVKALIGEIQREMREFIGSPTEAVKWVRSGGIHLTLQFLGNVMSNRVPDVESALQAACSGSRSFTLELGQLGAFPNIRQPRVLWLGLESDAEGQEELRKLHSAVANSMQGLGFKPDKNFKPHLTLGRMREDVSQSDLSAIATGITNLQTRATFEAQFKVTSVSLMKSDLLPTGAVYTQLADIPLGSK